MLQAIVSRRDGSGVETRLGSKSEVASCVAVPRLSPGSFHDLKRDFSFNTNVVSLGRCIYAWVSVGFRLSIEAK